MNFTCVTCARRKVRCDKIAPTCSTCRKARLDCVYQEPPPRKRKRKPVEDVHERLEQYEKLLKQNGIIPGDESEKTSPSDSAQVSDPPVTSKPKGSATGSGKLLGPSGKSRYIDSNVWRNIGEDDFQLSSDEDEEGETQPTSVYHSASVDPVSAALLGPGSPTSQSLINLHPPYEAAMKLWRLYVDSIHPIVMVVHVPSTQTMLQRAAANPSTASKATEALLFAIYHFAVVTISEDQCQELFGESQARLRSRYYDAVRQALVNAYFLRTHDFAVFQAYILFLLSVRSTCDSHTFWILTGVAVRISQRMGLHRDGEALGLKPFDVQMRRRVFWQLLPLDGLAGQLCGTGISITPESWDTKQPLNLNDADIWSDMTETPVPHVGATDMIFCLARTEIAKFVQKSNPILGTNAQWDAEDMAQRDKKLSALEGEMETKYLRYCDFANPVHTLTMGLARSACTSGKLRIRLPRAKSKGANISESDRREIWHIANKILDYDVAVHNNPDLKKFMWHLKAFFQFDPMIWILNEVRRDPLAPEHEAVWSKIQITYDNHPEMLTSKRALLTAIARLVTKAWDSYVQKKPRDSETPMLPEPPCVTAIRGHLSRRGSSDTGSVTASKHTYNPFDPELDPIDDMPMPQFASPTQNMRDFDWNQMIDFNTDSMDWMFWDQLVRDPVSFPSS